MICLYFWRSFVVTKAPKHWSPGVNNSDVSCLGLKRGSGYRLLVQKVLSVTDTMCCGVDMELNIDIENSISSL